MSQFLALEPVSAAIYGALNVAALTALATGGVTDDPQQGQAFPFVSYELIEEAELGGFGSRSGTDTLPLIELRVHVFTQTPGWTAANAIMAKVKDLLKTAPTVSGYASCAIFHDRTVPLPDEQIAGKKCKELVGFFRLFVEQA